MFNKASKDVAPTPARPPEPSPAPQQPPQGFAQPPATQTRKAPERIASVLGADLVIKGGIEGRGEIQLQGRAWGDVKVERLVVGEAAELEGGVEAASVEVRGRVIGSITARQVRLMPTAKVEGDITYELLHIEQGAQFEGKCIRTKPSANTAPVPVAVQSAAEPDEFDIPAAPAESLAAAQ
jgi:cytoskeletal protein CcmA (bactofilin family)